MAEENTPAAIVPPAVQAQLDAALAQVAALSKTVNDRAVADDQQKLAVAFPAIKDWSVIAGANFAEKHANATKTVAMFPAVTAPAPIVAVVPAPSAVAHLPGKNPGDGFAPPPMGSTSAEGLSAQAVIQKQNDLNEAVAKGNIARTLDLCVELQPERLKHMYAGTA